MQANKRKIKVGKYTFNYSDRTHIMGILNFTPDSFSDGGHFNHLEKAQIHAKALVEAGADIIDVGGESTRPGASFVSEEEELKRILPIIKAISKEEISAISVDTYKAEVAKQALEAGAHIINDIWGAKADPKMGEVAAHYQVPIILMHNRENKNYQDVIQDMIADLKESISIVKQAGVKDENIIVDPGIGFAKDYEHNLEVMRNLDKLVSLEYPVLLGTSRKRFIGHALDAEVGDRLEGTIATVCLGIERGCQFVRVHDVHEVKKASMMMDAMLGRGESHG